MGKFSNTWSLMGASWKVLRKDKEILIFPLISGICCLLVLASFAIPMYKGGYLQDSDGNWSFPPQPPGDGATTLDWVNHYAFLFLFYFVTYFVIVFFNVAVIACAKIRMSGGNPTLIDGFRASFSRLDLIIGWALVSATVGLIIRILEDRSEKAGKIVAGLFGMAWTVVSFLAIPIMVIEEKGPITSLKESAKMLKKTWGEQLIGNFSFGLIFFLLGIPAFILIVMGFLLDRGITMIVSVGLAAVYLIVIALIQSTLQSIFQAALYLYARKQQVPAGFQEGLLKGSMR